MELECHKIPVKKVYTVGKSLALGALLGSVLLVAMMIVFLHNQSATDRQLLVIEKSIVIASEPLQVIQSPFSKFLLSKTDTPEKGNHSETETFYLEDDSEVQKENNSTDVSDTQLIPLDGEKNSTDSKEISKNRSFKAKVTLSKWSENVLRNIVKEKLLKAAQKQEDAKKANK